MNQGIKQEKRKPERQKKNQACTGFERVRIPYKPEFFFRLSFRNLQKLRLYCDDLLSFKVWYSSLPCSSYHLRREFSRISHFYNFFYN